MTKQGFTLDVKVTDSLVGERPKKAKREVVVSRNAVGACVLLDSDVRNVLGAYPQAMRHTPYLDLVDVHHAYLQEEGSHIDLYVVHSGRLDIPKGVIVLAVGRNRERVSDPTLENALDGVLALEGILEVPVVVGKSQEYKRTMDVFQRVLNSDAVQ